MMRQKKTLEEKEEQAFGNGPRSKKEKKPRNRVGSRSGGEAKKSPNQERPRKGV